MSSSTTLEQAPPSPEYVPDPMELEDHVPVGGRGGSCRLSADGGDDDDDESSGDDDDDDDEVEEDEEEEEHLAHPDSIAIASLAVDHVPFAKETKLFETDEFAATPPPPPAYRTTPRIAAMTDERCQHYPPISSLLPSEEHHPLLPIPLPAPSTSHIADIPEADILSHPDNGRNSGMQHNDQS
ncbi:hypothetical protein Tco_0718586 [Tanacetum coccineum]